MFIASDPQWAAEFERRRIPIVGDDVKSQLGATIVHRALAQLFADRGVALDRTYQLNVGGNTDFLNMLNHERTASKRISKTEAVQSVLPHPLPAEQIHIGPSDYVAWQRDNKVCFLRMEGRGFGNAPIEIELRLSVQDSPNSAGCVIDAIRCCRVARDRGVGGAAGQRVVLSDEAPAAAASGRPRRATTSSASCAASWRASRAGASWTVARSRRPRRRW